jgi:hypothetical protein
VVKSTLKEFLIAEDLAPFCLIRRGGEGHARQNQPETQNPKLGTQNPEPRTKNLPLQPG